MTEHGKEIVGELHGTLGPMIATGTARVRSNFANLHLLNARRFALEAKGVEQANVGAEFGAFWDELQAHATSAVLFAAFSLEAWVNEISFDRDVTFADPRERSLVDWFEQEQRNVSTLDKLGALTAIRSQTRPDYGKDPGQSVTALVRLRNALVHYKPAWSHQREDHAKLDDLLRGKFELSGWLNEPEGIFPRRCMTSSGARWAIRSVVNFTDEVEKANGWKLTLADLGKDWDELKHR
jgi:hypothetical protein